jgi:hypothetical protein
MDTPSSNAFPPDRVHTCNHLSFPLVAFQILFHSVVSECSIMASNCGGETKVCVFVCVRRRFVCWTWKRFLVVVFGVQFVAFQVPFLPHNFARHSIYSPDTSWWKVVGKTRDSSKESSSKDLVTILWFVVSCPV